MDDTASNGDSSLNEAIWEVDLSGVPSPILSFNHTTLGEYDDPLPPTFSGHADGDGVCVSVDGVNWVRVWQGIDSINGTFANVTLDLGAAARAAGISLGANTRIKFQQYGEFPSHIGRRVWDDVTILNPSLLNDVYSFSAQAGEHVTLGTSRQGMVGALPAVSLFDSAGSVLAVGESSATHPYSDSHSYDSGIFDFAVPVTGTYYAGVGLTSSDAATTAAPYQLVVTVGAVVERRGKRLSPRFPADRPRRYGHRRVSPVQLQ